MGTNKYLETSQIQLRALEPQDIHVLYSWENNTDIWADSSTIAPFSKDILEKYIENSHLDIYAARQLRLMIVLKSLQKTIGTIDLYDFDPHNSRAGIGIYIAPEFSGKGYAYETLECLLDYCKNILLLHQVFSEVSVLNTKSLELFKKAGFSVSGIKKEWIRTPATYVDVTLMQYIF